MIKVHKREYVGRTPAHAYHIDCMSQLKYGTGDAMPRLHARRETALIAVAY